MQMLGVVLNRKPRACYSRPGAVTLRGLSPECDSGKVILGETAPDWKGFAMANHLATHKKLSVLHHLVEGSSIRSTERLTGVHRDTIMRLLVRTGDKCRDFLDHRMRGLCLDHLEVDEMWTFVHKKQGKLKIQERSNPKIGDTYLWIAIDQQTKLIPTFILGKRTTEMARRFMLDLENLAAACALFIAYFNFCWRQRKAGTTGRRRVTPAMASSVTDTLWSLPDLLEAINHD